MYTPWQQLARINENGYNNSFLTTRHKTCSCRKFKDKLKIPENDKMIYTFWILIFVFPSSAKDKFLVVERGTSGYDCGAYARRLSGGRSNRWLELGSCWWERATVRSRNWFVLLAWPERVYITPSCSARQMFRVPCALAGKSQPGPKLLGKWHPVSRKAFYYLPGLICYLPSDCIRSQSASIVHIEPGNWQFVSDFSAVCVDFSFQVV